jgi:RNA polymerase sigma-70 factor (ECF subfamily)
MQPHSARDLRFSGAVHGDRDSFEALVREHQSMVYSIALHFLRDPALAEELAQDVFVELYRALPSLDSADHVTNWLRRARRSAVALDDVPEPATAPQTADPLMARLLAKLTATLPEKARAVVILRYAEDLEPSEIAGVLDMPVNTVKSHLQRSLAMLREKLERTRVRS